ncbi:hypothetical protein ASF21_12785 [Arthrobacter sp. Leaf234]|nr:hypothetical protein ASF21_12785 [Arthrobacter sp. Leaf234]
MTIPSFVEAFDAYAHAIACGAPSTVQADRFADLTAAHRTQSAPDEVHFLGRKHSFRAAQR